MLQVLHDVKFMLPVVIPRYADKQQRDEKQLKLLQYFIDEALANNSQLGRAGKPPMVYEDYMRLVRSSAGKVFGGVGVAFLLDAGNSSVEPYSGTSGPARGSQEYETTGGRRERGGGSRGSGGGGGGAGGAGAGGGGAAKGGASAGLGNAAGNGIFTEVLILVCSKLMCRISGGVLLPRLEFHPLPLGQQVQVYAQVLHGLAGWRVLQQEPPGQGSQVVCL